MAVYTGDVSTSAMTSWPATSSNGDQPAPGQGPTTVADMSMTFGMNPGAPPGGPNTGFSAPDTQQTNPSGQNISDSINRDVADFATGPTPIPDTPLVGVGNVQSDGSWWKGLLHSVLGDVPIGQYDNGNVAMYNPATGATTSTPMSDPTVAALTAMSDNGAPKTAAQLANPPMPTWEKVLIGAVVVVGLFALFYGERSTATLITAVKTK